MEIIFNCPHCEQELAVDSEGAGAEIKCPTCGEKITIPAAPGNVTPLPAGASTPIAGLPSNPIASSAAAKVVMHLKVPVRDRPSDPLIQKPQAPLEAVAKGADKQVRIRTIRHASCIESGHDRFDERVTEFLNRTGESNLVGIHVINYEHFDVGTQKVMVDFGVMIVYRG
jgi:DNA-directed RNA polymerase subunit RPC12/RpoP